MGTSSINGWCLPSLIPGGFFHLESSGWWYTYPSEKYESQLGLWNSQYMENKIHVPNHQPDLCFQLIIKKIPSLCQGTIRGNVQPRDTCDPWDPWDPCDPWPSWPMLKVWWQSPQIHIYLTRSDASGYSSASCCPGIKFVKTHLTICIYIYISHIYLQ